MTHPALASPVTLSVRDLKVRAGAATLLDGLSFSLRPGELAALIGPSGAGKSTLIKVLLGLRAASEGEVRLGDVSGRAPVPIGYVPQADALHLTLTPQAALDFSAQLRLPHLSAEARAERIAEVARQVGLNERMDLKIARLSGGQRKRVSVAMELLTEPAVLILDEPTSGLDPGMEARMMALFHDLARRGRIVLVATHAMESLGRCDAVLVLVRGQQAYLGDPDGALSFFRVDRFAGLFDQLPKQSPAAWTRAWARSEERRRFEARPPVGTAPIAAPPAPVEAPPAASAPAADASPSAAERLAALKRARGSEA